MEEQNTTQPKKQRELSMPMALVLSAIIIAIALIVIKMPRTARIANTQVDSTAQNTALFEGVLDSKGKLAIDPITASDHIVGAKNPSITIVEYSDLECPYCKRFHGTMQKIMEKYSDKVAWVYRHYPLDCVDNTDPECTVLHTKARNEAIASECATAQGGNDAFWEFTNEIFAVSPTNDRLDPKELTATAKKMGLDVPAFDACVANQTYADVVSKQAKGGVALGVGGTPFSVIIDRDGNTYKLEGAYPYEVMEAVIEKLVK